MLLLQNTILFLYLMFFVFALISPFLPLSFLWRSACLSVIILKIGGLLEGPVHWSNQNIGWAIGVAIFFLFSCVIIFLLVVRLRFAAIGNELTIKRLIGPDNFFKKSFDIVILLALGCLIGLFLTSSLAYLLPDLFALQSLDIIIASLACTLTIVSLFFYRVKASFVATAMFGTVAVVSLLGLSQASRILSSAQILADGQPWCLATSDFSRKITEVDQLGFYSLKKQSASPHLGLLIKDDEQIYLAAHWSIRQQRFVPKRNVGANVSTCLPIQDYENELESGKIDKHLYAVGAEIYSISPEFSPNASTQHLSIQSNLITGIKSVYPEITERITLINDARVPSVPKNAMPLSKLYTSEEIKLSDLKGTRGVIVAGLNKDTGQYLILKCLFGPYEDELCYAQVIMGKITYKFYLPFRQIRYWSDVVFEIENLFESFRVIHKDAIN